MAFTDPTVLSPCIDGQMRRERVVVSKDALVGQHSAKTWLPAAPAFFIIQADKDLPHLSRRQLETEPTPPPKRGFQSKFMLAPDNFPFPIQGPTLMAAGVDNEAVDQFIVAAETQAVLDSEDRDLHEEQQAKYLTVGSVGFLVLTLAMAAILVTRLM